MDRAEDPDYVREHNVPIDVDYYIKKQILPPVERILGVFGVKTSSLDYDSKQKGLFDFEPKKPEKEEPSSAKGQTKKDEGSCSDPGRGEQLSLFDF